MGHKIFITGATGFMGSALVDFLINNGDDLFLLVRKGGNFSHSNVSNVHYIVGDINDVDSYQKFLHGVDIVYHLAGVVTDWAPRKLFFRVNTDATKALLSEAIKNNVKRFIYISTIDVLKRSRYKHNIINEFSEYTDTRMPYHRSKMLAEKNVLESNGANGMETVVVQPAWVYGPGDKTLLPEIVRQLRSKSVFLLGKKDTQIPLVYIDNLIDVLIRLRNHPNLGGHIYLVADDDDITWFELVNKVKQSLSKNSKIFFLPIWVGFVLGIISDIVFKILRRTSRPTITSIGAEMISSSIKVDNMKLRRDLGYSQKISFEEGFIRAIDSIKNIRKE